MTSSVRFFSCIKKRGEWRQHFRCLKEKRGVPLNLLHLGKKNDPMFVYRWKRDIARSLQKKLAPRNAGEPDAALHGVIFASALIGVYPYMVFENPAMPDDKLAGCLDKLLMRTLHGWGRNNQLRKRR